MYVRRVGSTMSYHARECGKARRRIATSKTLSKSRRTPTSLHARSYGERVAPDNATKLEADQQQQRRSLVGKQPPPRLQRQERARRMSQISRLSADDAAAAAAARNYRRSSLAATLHANFIGLAGHPDAFDVARRRLSNVSDVVSRKISKTIGWRSLSVSVELTVSQGASLCGQYMRNRLKRSGIFHRKLGLKRMRSAKLLAGGALVQEVYPELVAVGAELEKMHPKLFERIGRQIGCGTFNSEQRVVDALTDIAREMLRAGECNWARIVALYAVTGGMAVDCVKQGKPEFLAAIQKGMTMVLEEDLAAWIQANGGWSALALRYRPVPKQIDWPASTVILCIAVTTVFVGIVAMFIRVLML